MILVVLWVLCFDFSGCDLICDLVDFCCDLILVGFCRGGGCDLILVGFRQWCVVDELEKLRP